MEKVTEKSAKYRTEIQQMMFVSGETSEPSVETTTMIESIVQQQVIEMLKEATALAARRGVRSIAIEDLIFLIRHDKAKVSRLRTFLSWKDVRKTARDNDDKPGGGDDFGAGDDPVVTGAAAGGGGAQANPADAATKGINKHRKAKVRLPWDVSSFYAVALPERDDDEGGGGGGGGAAGAVSAAAAAAAGPDEEEEEVTSATLQRLKSADERTKNMTREEYVHYSECRQASFTFRKGKRFREWAGFGIVTDSKPNDDIVDILGFLTFEIVQTLTEEALKVKAAEDVWGRVGGGKNSRSANGGDGGAGDSGRGSRGVTPGAGGGVWASGTTEEGGIWRKRKREMGLFDPPEEERAPVQPKHVQEGFRRLQGANRKTKALGSFTATQLRRPLKLV